MWCLKPPATVGMIIVCAPCGPVEGVQEWRVSRLDNKRGTEGKDFTNKNNRREGVRTSGDRGVKMVSNNRTSNNCWQATHRRLAYACLPSSMRIGPTARAQIAYHPVVSHEKVFFIGKLAGGTMCS